MLPCTTQATTDRNAVLKDSLERWQVNLKAPGISIADVRIGGGYTYTWCYTLNRLL